MTPGTDAPSLSPPSIIEGLSPIFVTSPAPRAGTTALQRLLCSDPGTLLFGDSFGSELLQACQLFAARTLFIQHSAPAKDAMLEAVLAGVGDGWIADMLPPSARYIDSLSRAAFGPIVDAWRWSEEQGRPRYGAKMAGFNPAQMRLLRLMFPAVKLIVIDRPLLEVARSAKAVGLLPTPEDRQNFARLWLDNQLYLARELTDAPGTLRISYQNLVEGPEHVCDMLAEHTGATAMKPALLADRYNTVPGDGRATADDGRTIPPMDLTPEEQAFFEQVQAQL